MEIFFELIFTLYLELGEILIPEHKFKKWQEVLLKITGVFVSLIICILLIVGISVLVDTSKKTLGIVLVVIGGVLLLIQIILFVIVIVHQIKKEKQEKITSENKEKLSNIDE